MQCGFRMGDRLDQRDIGADDIPQRILGVSGRCRAQHLDPGALSFDLAAQLLENLDRVLDRIALGKLIGPGQDLAFQGKEHGLGGCGAAVDSDEASRRISRIEFGRRERRRGIILQKCLHFFLRIRPARACLVRLCCGLPHGPGADSSSCESPQ